MGHGRELCRPGTGRILRGAVVDSATRTPLANASVAIRVLAEAPNQSRRGFSDNDRRRKLDLVITSVGYNPRTLHLDSLPGQQLVIALSRQYHQLKDVTVRNKKQRYRNKDNPAVELIRHVIDNKDRNRMEAYSYASYEKYEKLQLSIDKASAKVGQSKLLKPYHFLVENGDTTKMEGRTLSPVYLEETLSDVYYRKNPEKTKTVVVGKRKVDFGEFVDMAGSRPFSTGFTRISTFTIIISPSSPTFS